MFQLHACHSVLLSARLPAPSMEIHACHSLLLSMMFLLHLSWCTEILACHSVLFSIVFLYCYIICTFHGNAPLSFRLTFNDVPTAPFMVHGNTCLSFRFIFNCVPILLYYMHFPRKCTLVIPFYFQRCS